MPHAAEGHMMGGQMDDGIVDAAPAEGNLLQDTLLKGLAFGKQIESQRLFPLPDEADGVIGLVIGKNGKNRPEDLLLHGGAFRRSLRHGRSYGQRRFIGFSAQKDGFPLQDSAKPLKMLLVDNFRKFGIFPGILPQGILYIAFQKAYKVLFSLPLYKHVIRGHAGLAGVQKLAEHQPPGRHRQIRRFVDDAGAFAPQLQNHGSQVLGSLFHHQLPYGDAAGEKDEIEALLQKAGVFLPPAFHHSYMSRGKNGGNEICQQMAGMGRIGGGLQNDAIPRGNGSDERIQA